MKKSVHTCSDRFGQRPYSFDFSEFCPHFVLRLVCLTFCEKMQFRNKGFGNYSNRDIKKFIPDLKKTTTTIIIATTKTKTKADKFEALAPNSFRAVSKILSCRVNTTSRRRIKQLEISFGSIFLLFSYESSRGPRS